MGYWSSHLLLWPSLTFCGKAGGEFTRMLPMNTISQVKAKEQSWLAVYWPPVLVDGGAPWSWGWPIRYASQELQSKSHQHHIKTLYNSSHVLLVPSRVQWRGRGLALFLNSRMLIWSSPDLHSSFLNSTWWALSLHTNCASWNRCLCSTGCCARHLHSVSSIYQLHKKLNLQAKRQRKTGSDTLSPFQEPISALFTTNSVHTQ